VTKRLEFLGSVPFSLFGRGPSGSSGPNQVSLQPTRWTTGGAAGLALCISLAVALVGCGDGDPTTGPINPSPTFALLSYPGNECPLVGGEDVTFKIDASLPEAVTAAADDGRVYRVQWPPGFFAGTAADPVVRDRTGLVVAREGQRLIQPTIEFARLPGGYEVCFGGGSIWVQDRR
jgi:hypothetical protein